MTSLTLQSYDLKDFLNNQNLKKDEGIKSVLFIIIIVISINQDFHLTNITIIKHFTLKIVRGQEMYVRLPDKTKATTFLLFRVEK